MLRPQDMAALSRDMAATVRRAVPGAPQPASAPATASAVATATAPARRGACCLPASVGLMWQTFSRFPAQCHVECLSDSSMWIAHHVERLRERARGACREFLWSMTNRISGSYSGDGRPSQAARLRCVRRGRPSSGPPVTRPACRRPNRRHPATPDSGPWWQVRARPRCRPRIPGMHCEGFGVQYSAVTALVAQRIEHLTTDQKVGGSSPSERATEIPGQSHHALSSGVTPSSTGRILAASASRLRCRGGRRNDPSRRLQVAVQLQSRGDAGMP